MLKSLHKGHALMLNDNFDYVCISFPTSGVVNDLVMDTLGEKACLFPSSASLWGMVLELNCSSRHSIFRKARFFNVDSLIIAALS